MEPLKFSAFSSILFYCALILLSPITSFFVGKFFIFEGIFGLESVASNVWSAILAVVVLHVAVGLYIYRAYFEAERAKPEDKKD